MHSTSLCVQQPELQHLYMGPNKKGSLMEERESGGESRETWRETGVAKWLVERDRGVIVVLERTLLEEP